MRKRCCCVRSVQTFVIDDGDDISGVANSPSDDVLTSDCPTDGSGLELGTENAEIVTNSRLSSLQVIFYISLSLRPTLFILFRM